MEVEIKKKEVAITIKDLTEKEYHILFTALRYSMHRLKQHPDRCVLLKNSSVSLIEVECLVDKFKNKILGRL